MSEQPSDDAPIPTRRMDQVIAITRIEAKLDVSLAQQAAHRDETNRRLAEHDALFRQVTETLGQIQQKQAASDAVAKAEAADKPRRMDTGTWVAIVVAVITALYLVLDHYSGAGQ